MPPTPNEDPAPRPQAKTYAIEDVLKLIFMQVDMLMSVAILEQAVPESGHPLHVSPSRPPCWGDQVRSLGVLGMGEVT